MVDNMDINVELKTLLHKKRELFLNVETITNEINEFPIDRITELLEKRGEALEHVILIDNQIQMLIVGNEELQSVLSCTCEISELKDELKELFEEVLRIKAIVNRIIKNEDTIRLKIESERDSLLNKIETINSSSNSIAESYKRSVNTGFSQGNTSNTKKTI